MGGEIRNKFIRLTNVFVNSFYVFYSTGGGNIEIGVFGKQQRQQDKRRERQKKKNISQHEERSTWLQCFGSGGWHMSFIPLRNRMFMYICVKERQRERARFICVCLVAEEGFVSVL